MVYIDRGGWRGRSLHAAYQRMGGHGPEQHAHHHQGEGSGEREICLPMLPPATELHRGLVQSGKEDSDEESGRKRGL